MENYIWKGIGSHSKKITVLKEDLNELKVNSDHYYLTVLGNNAGEFILRSHTIEEGEPIELH